MVCLDTTFLVDIIKGREDVSNLEKDIDENQDNISITSPSIVELFKGIYLKKNRKHVSDSEINKINEILSSFSILDLDKESAKLAGEIEASLIDNGDIIDIEDIMIASICKHHGEKLITRNVKHFEKISELEIEGY